MVTRNSTRARSRVRHSPASITADPSRLARHLRDVRARLTFLGEAIAFAVDVLESQAADRDLDVARELRRAERDVVARAVTGLNRVLSRLEEERDPRLQQLSCAQPHGTSGRRHAFS